MASARTAGGAARPDPSFGRGRGFVTTSIRRTTTVAYGAVNTFKGLVVVGEAITRSGNGQIVVVRYRRNGSLDPSFGSRGIFETAFPAAKGPFIATSVRQTRFGKLLVGGGYGLGSMLALRLTPNGRLDRTFGPRRRGWVAIASGGVAQSIAVQRSGEILLGGSNANRNGRPMVVAGLTANGDLDRRYGTRGIATLLFWNADLASSTGVDEMVTTVRSGVIGFTHLDYIGSDGHGSAGVFQLSSRGRLIPGYGTGGHTEIAFTEPSGVFAQWFPCAMTSVGAGVIVTGDGSTGGAASLLSARLTGRGVLSSTFGNAGRSIAPGPGQDSYTTCGATATAGGIIAGVGDVLVGLKADGSPNRSFARGGRLTITKPRRVAINSVTATARRTVTVAGSAGNSIYVARYRF